MEYLFNLNKTGSAAHIWLGSDTACRMYSTGGLRPGNKKTFPSPMGKRVCHMCQVNMAKIDPNFVNENSEEKTQVNFLRSVLQEKLL